MKKPARFSSKLLPFSWTGYDDLDFLEIQFYDVLFTSDFGSFKVGDTRRILAVDFDNGKFVEYGEDGSHLSEHRFTLQSLQEEASND